MAAGAAWRGWYDADRRPMLADALTRFNESLGESRMREKHGLDATDIRILSAVQKHGQLSKTKLAEIVNLSPTPCWERLTRLKAAGFIRGYRADIALDRIADFAQVVVTVSLTHHRKSDFARFEAHIRDMDEITRCIATGGGMDYVMTVICPSLAAFQSLMDSLLSAELGIERYMTYIATREVKSEPPNIARLAARPAR
jgi:Lrp/AsnC family transcriptional regulator, regulator of ectoine-degradation genes